ncbi:properdin isoform X2 [Paramormyrops kingsleyae]|uniref:properdin isoform X2 n=1 Tax=Paramormyrops kingsleyae TaxID=1676925 RepID=UPI000CD6045D|nr:properdin isoform X2 [Paramormyrops kingsleyae]
MLLWVVHTALLSARISGGTTPKPQMVECFSDFGVESGSCSLLLGRVSLVDCCLNPRYGFQDDDGKCRSCRPASWSEWSEWGHCTVSCLEGVRQRRRFCYGQGDCEDAEALGILQTQSCEDQACCPQSGGWTEWGKWGACSVTCQKGSRSRRRMCTEPPPICGGSCEGEDTMTEECDTGICPVHGAWAKWSSWTHCSRSCLTHSMALPTRHRTRNCTNPEPSDKPPGMPCPGQALEEQDCNNLPACPVDGLWSAWAPWSKCARHSRNITCKTYAGSQMRERSCKFTAWEGKSCPENPGISETRICYDISNCKMNGKWDEWSEWGLCKPSCGPGAQKTRMRTCQPDVSMYMMLVGSKREQAYFSGKPLESCPKLDEKVQTQACLHVPSCMES